MATPLSARGEKYFDVAGRFHGSSPRLKKVIQSLVHTEVLISLLNTATLLSLLLVLSLLICLSPRKNQQPWPAI